MGRSLGSSVARSKGVVSVPAFVWRESGKPPSVSPTEIRTSISPIIGSLVYCESSTFEHPAIEAGYVHFYKIILRKTSVILYLAVK
uniref:Uncharacterized protein n=1 Tax=Timema bartmani TaxID=61472 RepID=A0A7R9F4N6_9NEOP|nr:unnamed protein product [Timema bartmani]